MVDLQRCLEEVLVQDLLAGELVIREHDQVRVSLGVPRILVFHRVEQHLNLQLNQVKFVFATMDGDLEVFFAEDVRSDVCHVLNSIVQDRQWGRRIEHVCGILTEEYVVSEGLKTASEGFEAAARVAARVAQTIRANRVGLVDRLHLDQV